MLHKIVTPRLRFISLIMPMICKPVFKSRLPVVSVGQDEMVGLLTKARAMATRSYTATESWSRLVPRPVAQPDQLQHRISPVRAFARFNAGEDQRRRDLLQGRRGSG